MLLLIPSRKEFARAREFRKVDSLGRTNRWIIQVKGNVVSMTSGLVGSELRDPTTHIEKGVNIGKSNETTDEEQARFWAQGQIDDKHGSGYREVNRAGEYIEELAKQEIDYNNLAENFRLYKPVQHMSPYMQKMVDAGTCWYTRKRKGVLGVFVVQKDGQVVMYSSTLKRYHKDEPTTPWLTRYPDVERDLLAAQLPPETIIMAEICPTLAGFDADDEGFDIDNQDYVNGIRGSLAEVALTTQGEQGMLGICMFDMPMRGGKCWAQEVPYHDRLAELINIAKKSKDGALTYPEVCTVLDPDESVPGVVLEMTSPNLLKPVYYNVSSLEEVHAFLLNLAKEKGWEGWVVVDPNATYGEKTFNFRGHAERPKECCKAKPKFNADFWVEYDPDNGVGERGKGKKKVGVGSVFCYLYDPVKKEKVFVGKCGGGLSDADVVKYADTSLYPMVWEVEFDSWTKNGSIEFPVKVGERDDKTPEECTIDQRPTTAEEEG